MTHKRLTTKENQMELRSMYVLTASIRYTGTLLQPHALYMYYVIISIT